MSKEITVVKCRCGDPYCRTYGLSDGQFYGGSGWNEERAQEYADAINKYDKDKRLLAAVAQVGRKTDA